MHQVGNQYSHVHNCSLLPLLGL